MTVEELQEALLQEQEKNKTLQSDYDGLKAKNEELVASNARLTEYNNKLFMRVSEPVKDEPKEEDLTADELEVKEIENIRKLMKERRF